MIGQVHLLNTDRLAALERYQTTSAEREPALERIVELAKRTFKVPIVLVSFLGRECQWVKAAQGFSEKTVDLKRSFCVQTIRTKGVNVVLDVSEDDVRNHADRFDPNERIRFYAGAPLTTTDGHNIGTLCLIDTAPHHKFSCEAEATLLDLAAVTMRELELKLTVEKLRAQTEQTTKILRSIAEAAYFLDKEWRFAYLNGHAETLLQRHATTLVGKEVWKEFPETEGSVLYQKYFCAQATQTQQIFEYYYPPLEAWFEVHAYPSEDGLWVYFQEINARKEAERKAASQAAFRRSLLAFTQASLQQKLDASCYQRLVEIAVATIPGAQAGSLLVRRGDKHVFTAAVGFNLAALQTTTIDFGVEKHFSPDSFEPQLVKQWGTHGFDSQTQSVMLQEGRINDIKVSLCVPIAIDAQHVLTLFLDNFDSPDAFDDEAVEMTRMLAQQAASLTRRIELDEALTQERSELTQLAHYDQLTGLPNRTLLDERLRRVLTDRDVGGSLLAVLFLDLDNFKEINDSYGHSFGDVLLTKVAARLKDCLRKEDALARWGGDEFVVMLPNLLHVDEAVEIAERVRKAVRRPISMFGHTLHTTVSIGMTFRTTPEQVADDLLRQADTALYEAKKGKDRSCLFDLEMTKRLRHKIELSSDFRAAVRDGEILLHYQPRIRLADGQITSVEALARWHHPQKGWIPPAVFIPLAEEIGLIKQLGRCILDMACEQAKSWQAQGITCRVAVNLSVEQLKHADIVEEVTNVLLTHQLEPDLLELEITESAAMADVQDSVKKLQRLRDLGIYLSVDDFGTAYSSLAYLQRLPLQSLKIDKSFVSDISIGEGDKTSDVRVVVAIIALAKSLGLNIVAEGVETAVQRDILEQLGCTEAQGYLFAKPLAAPDVKKLLEPSALQKIDWAD